jgi:hypothetical protein
VISLAAPALVLHLITALLVQQIFSNREVPVSKLARLLTSPTFPASANPASLAAIAAQL